MITILLAATFGVTLAQGGPESFFCSSVRFGYTGTISVYNTFAEAQSGRNPRHSSVVVPNRDGAIYIVRNRPTFYEDFNAFLTFWSSHEGQNPNNTNLGFIQMYDDDASNWLNQKGYWNRSKTTFTVEAMGRNATYPSGANPGDYARLWNAGAVQGSGESTKGTFLRYEYKFIVTGVQGTDDDQDGFFEYRGPDGQFSGYFKGIFENESASSPGSNGFYVVELSFNNTSWSVANNFTKNNAFGSSRTQGN